MDVVAPRALRLSVLKEPALFKLVEKSLLRAVWWWQRAQARGLGASGHLEGGAVAMVQYFGSHLQFTPHIHLLVAEAVWDAAGRQVVVPPPDDAAVEAVLRRLLRQLIIDLFSRFVVGWALSALNDRHLTIKALDMALRRRCPGAGLLHHSDQGSTYASEDYQRVLDAHGLTCSMSRRGNCYDNAAMESWNSTLKSELGERFESSADAKARLFDYIEVFYNQARMHSSIDYASPAEFERDAVASKAAA